jgi:phosphoglycolate phosphatase-like HAD superfamily hydrolase
VYSIARERIAAKSGVCTKAHVYHSDSLQAIAQRFADSIELPYIFNLQFMKNTDGQYVITDVNLRTAGGMSLSYAAGWDEVDALGKIILGEGEVVASVSKPIQEQFVMRAYTDIVTKRVNKRICFDLDGTLLDSRERHRVVMNHVLKEYKCNIDTSDYLQYKAEGNNNLSWLEMKGIDKILAKDINQRWIELIENNVFLNNDTLYPQVRRILESLSRDNFLLLLTARNNQENTEMQIDRLGISQFFDKIVVVPSSKQTSVLKSQILSDSNITEYYGDTESDMEAAKMAKCRFYATTRGFRSDKFWDKYDVKLAFFNI